MRGVIYFLFYEDGFENQIVFKVVYVIWSYELLFQKDLVGLDCVNKI